MAKNRQWAYRPTDKEHEALLRVLRQSSEYNSVAQFVREAVLRLILDNDQQRLFTLLGEAIHGLERTKEEIIDVLIQNSRSETE